MKKISRLALAHFQAFYWGEQLSPNQVTYIIYIKLKIKGKTIPDGSMLRFTSNLEQASLSSTAFCIFSLFVLILVGLDKKIKFHKVIGVEHMLRMKKFSSSQTYFKLSAWILLAGAGFLVAIFKPIYTNINPDEKSVSTHIQTHQL